MRYIYLVNFALLILFAGCDEFLEEDLRDEIPTENFFNNDTEAELAINGMYFLLHQGPMYRGNGLDQYYNFGADEVGPNRSVTGTTHNYLINEGVADGGGSWRVLYEIVRNSNVAISRIGDNELLSEEIRDRTLGEALFMRGLAYYHLTNLWGDVPYFRELLPLQELATIGRTDNDVIRTDMKSDLEMAFELLPDSYSDSDLGRATKWAAATLLAKYYLFDQEWELARDWSLRVINDSPHRLLDDYAAVFDQSDINNQYNDEHIFVVDFTKDPVIGVGNTQRTDFFNPRIRDEPIRRNQRPGGPGTQTRWQILQDTLRTQNEDFTGFGLAIPLPELADQSNWEEGDLRYEATIIQEYLGFQLSFPYFRKLWNLDQINSPRNNHSENYVIFRLADVYLMAAEAENELNGPGNAYQYVNAVRARAFDPDKPWAGISQQEFRERMYDERKFELAAEGHRRLDLIRWGILLETVRNVEHRPWNNPADNIMPKHVLLPIPLSEILLNPNLLTSDPTNNGYR